MDTKNAATRVIILDDQLVQREGIARVVDDSGCMHVVAAGSSPEEALEVVRREHLDLALVDLVLNRQRGTAIGRAMRRIQPDLKVIIYTHEKSMVLAADIFWSNKESGQPALQGYILTGNIIGGQYLQQIYKQVITTGHYIDREVLEDHYRLEEFEALTPREEECAIYVADGYSNDGICQKMGISGHRVENIISNLYLKFRILGDPGNPGRRVLLAESIQLLYKHRPPSQPLTVIIIDDQETQRAHLRRKLLDDHCLKVIGEAENGRQGLEIVRQTKPDVVLVDIRLPDLDGFRLTRQILEEFPHLLVIVNSASASPVYEEEAKAAGAIAMLPKQQITAARVYNLCRSHAPLPFSQEVVPLVKPGR
jgi:DNA-binding NarL/FixJ family response regulator